MLSLLQECLTQHSPESLVEALPKDSGVILLRSASEKGPQCRYSFVVARPFLIFRSFGSHCQVHAVGKVQSLFGNPWQILHAWIARYEILDEVDLPFPLGGCFGYWGFGLKNFTEPRLSARAVADLDLPDCHLGFYGSVVAFDHQLHKTWIVATGLQVDGSRRSATAREEAEWWGMQLAKPPDHEHEPPPIGRPISSRPTRATPPAPAWLTSTSFASTPGGSIESNLTRPGFLAIVDRALRYIRQGDIYQVNLAQRFRARTQASGWEIYRRLVEVSPAPFAAYIDGGDFQIASSSPELFLRLSGPGISTRPIKGTRPRSVDPMKDVQLGFELQTSPKELAELLMITDLLRNDLGKICEYGSVQVPELVRLERFAHVQHLVSTVQGKLRPGVSHLAALASCFPGGSITGAPKVRALEIIDELESVARGPYTGALGYLGFNRESQLSIIIRAAVCFNQTAYFHSGAGIVADSLPEAEFEETLIKAKGFFDAIRSIARDAAPRHGSASHPPLL